MAKCYKCGREVNASNVFECVNLEDGRVVCSDCDYKAAKALAKVVVVLNQ